MLAVAMPDATLRLGARALTPTLTSEQRQPNAPSAGSAGSYFASLGLRPELSTSLVMRSRSSAKRAAWASGLIRSSGNGSSLRLVGVSQDVTERKTAEER